MSTPARIVAIFLSLILPAFAQNKPATKPAATQPARPQRIVIIYDASGSMMNQLEFSRQIAQKLVKSFDDKQQFNVLILHNGKVNGIFQNLTPATQANQAKVLAITDKQSGAGSNPIVPAFEQAMRLRPDTIYLLSDGDYDPKENVLARLAAMDPGRRIRINPFIYEEGVYAALLRKIADVTKGEAIVVAKYID